MKIEYKQIHDFSREELERLFLSAGWSSGHFPDRLVIAMRNFDTVISAWDGDRLVGMACAMDDGIMNAYVHCLLVEPAYQGKTVGRTLVKKLREKYRDYLSIAVIAYDEERTFCENCGFVRSGDASPMFITSLWT